MCSLLKGFKLIVTFKASRNSQIFRFWLRGVQFVSAVGCTPGNFLRNLVQFDSAVWCTLRSLTLRCDAHHRAWLHSGMHTTELDSALRCTPWSFLRNLVRLSPWCDAHCGAWLCGGKHTPKLDFKVGTHRRAWLRGEKHTAELKSAAWVTP